jgi:acetyl esterase
MMWDAYLSGKTPKHIEYASPMEAASFAGFPPTYIEVAQYDCLRDEGILLYERFQEKGIPAELHEIKNACHGFETMTKSKITKTCMSRRINWLKQFL